MDKIVFQNRKTGVSFVELLAFLVMSLTNDSVIFTTKNTIYTS
jgi:hypothetical protein